MCITCISKGNLDWLCGLKPIPQIIKNLLEMHSQVLSDSSNKIIEVAGHDPNPWKAEAGRSTGTFFASAIIHRLQIQSFSLWTQTYISDSPWGFQALSLDLGCINDPCWSASSSFTGQLAAAISNLHPADYGF